VQFSVHKAPSLHGSQVLLNVRIVELFGAHESLPAWIAAPLCFSEPACGKKSRRPAIACPGEIQYA
jgi:hypothetical protein